MCNTDELDTSGCTNGLLAIVRTVLPVQVEETLDGIAAIGAAAPDGKLAELADARSHLSRCWRACRRKG